jgi:phosphate transport system permease protein
LIACAALALVFYYVARAGIGGLNPQFFHRPDPAHPESGGMMHAVVGTIELILMACAMGVPLGVLGGIYLAEFGNNRFGFGIRYATDLLNGVPSIVLGIFAYTLVTAIKKYIHSADGPSFQGYAGGFALGIMMIPTVMRTTEELVRLVPNGLREGSLALGATYARTVWKIVLPSARPGIVTGILLGVARIAGETAPLLMVGCNSQLWSINPNNAIASLPVQIYVLHDSVLPLALQQSWGVAVVLVLLVLLLNILARLLTRSRYAII